MAACPSAPPVHDASPRPKSREGERLKPVHEDRRELTPPAHAASKPRCSRFFLALLIAGGLCSGLAIALGSPATKVLVPFLALAMLNGYRSGGLKVVAGLFGLGVGGLLALPVGQACEGLVGRACGLTGLTGRMAGIAVAGILLAIVAALLADFFVGRKLRRRPAVARYDKWLGSGLGLAQGALLALVVFWGILVLEPVAAARLATAADGAEPIEPDPAASRIVGLVQLARESFAGRIADASNPLAEARFVTLPRKGLAMLNDPVALEAFHNHPAVQRVSERPVVKEVVEALAADPQINEMLQSDQGLSQRDLLVILGNPKLLKILDATNVLAELAPIADEIEEALDAALDHAAGERGAS